MNPELEAAAATAFITWIAIVVELVVAAYIYWLGFRNGRKYEREIQQIGKVILDENKSNPDA